MLTVAGCVYQKLYPSPLGDGIALYWLNESLNGPIKTRWGHAGYGIAGARGGLAPGVGGDVATNPAHRGR
jgi:hypothetical protein